jgi:hypothetical protein
MVANPEDYTNPINTLLCKIHKYRFLKQAINSVQQNSSGRNILKQGKYNGIVNDSNYVASCTPASPLCHLQFGT